MTDRDNSDADGDAPRKGSMRQRSEAAARRFQQSQAGTLWSRLSALDFLGNCFQLAALALLCFFPLLIVVTTAAGRDAAATVAGWLGLDQQASQAVASLFAEGENSGSLTLASAGMLLVGGVAVADTLQNWYQRLFDVPRRGWRDLPAQLAWLTLLFVYAGVQAVVGRLLGHVLAQAPFGLLTATGFWWTTMYVLLAPAVPWRALLPAAVVTALCWTGLGVFSTFYFSQTIVVNSEKYGPIGVVMVILSWLVAVGVVIHLGAVVGRMYAERRSRSRS
ncbi:YhjD/YihY/BrkB family envelope integrity protein [Streptomyces lateritius]|uniref:YhjD/YihY/BrkB family envelope integrity protein n=1 Tax=Streptomyces lateritius TaxID=67313 RepID=A0ABW6YNF4_9ACTN